MTTYKHDLWTQYIQIFVVESLYWIVSICAVFINDSILEETIYTDDLTVFVTFFQVTFSLALILSLDKIYKYQRRLNGYHIATFDPIQKHTSVQLQDCQSDSDDDSTNDHSKSKIAQDSLRHVLVVDVPRRLNFGTCKDIFPLSVLYVGMLLLNNYCLKNVGVAFYFVSRSLTTVFNVIFTYLLIDKSVSTSTLICCGMIILGFILGIDQESVFGSLSVIGIGFGISSSLFTSLFSIYTKKKLLTVDNNIWTLIMYNNMNAIIIIIPLLLIHGDIQALIDDKIVSAEFWTILSFSGVMSFLISMVTNASIKFTSPLTHNISGTAKSCFQTILAVCFKHKTKSVLWWLSNLVILLASAAYSRVRQLEMEIKSASSRNDSNPRDYHCDLNSSYDDTGVDTCRSKEDEKQLLPQTETKTNSKISSNCPA